MWIDSHCHITSGRYDADRDAVLARASAAGVSALLAIGSGYGIAGNEAAVALAGQSRDVWAAVGVHPHEASQLDDAGRERVRGWLRQPRVVAVGECGLDYHYMNSEQKLQREVFAWQVALAREFDRPVCIHVRGDAPDAYGELLDIWLAEGRGELQGVLHCYTGSLAFAQRGVAAGLHVSFSGIVTFPKSGELREVARALPLDRLLIETDAPFLAPQGHRGERNEPAWVGAVGQTLAELHAVPASQIARVTSANARRLFRLGDQETRDWT